jgi:hypothetical protein
MNGIKSIKEVGQFNEIAVSQPRCMQSIKSERGYALSSLIFSLKV